MWSGKTIRVWRWRLRWQHHQIIRSFPLAGGAAAEEVGFNLQISSLKATADGPRRQGHQAALLIPRAADLLEATWTPFGAESQTTGSHGDALTLGTKLL